MKLVYFIVPQPIAQQMPRKVFLNHIGWSSSFQTSFKHQIWVLKRPG